MTDPAAKATELVKVEDLPEFVFMCHPDIEGPPAGPISSAAFATIYQAKGWTLASDAEVVAAAEGRIDEIHAAETVALEDVESMDREALEKVAALRGIDYSLFQQFKGANPVGDFWLDGLRDAVRANVQDPAVFPETPIQFPKQ